MEDFPLVNFTKNIPQFEDQNWTTNSDFQFSSYKGLHDAANNSLSWIFPNFEDYTGFRLDPNDLTYFNTDEGGNVNVNDMISENKGPLIFGIVGLMLAFILTVVGIGWCVVQCCSCCSSKKAKLRAKKDSKGNKLPKIACGIIMIIWRVLFVTFLIALFVSNEQFKDAIDELPKDIDNGVVDSETFISLTQDQVDSVFKTSYEELAEVLLKIIAAEGGATKLAASEHRDQEATKSFKTAKQILENLDVTMAGIEVHEVVPRIRNLQHTLTELQSNVDSTRVSTLALKGLPEQIELIRSELSGNAEALNSALRDVPINQTREDIKEIEKEFDRAKGPAFHSINGLNLFLLLIIVLLTVGAIIGIFSPKFGSRVTNCGLLTIFITAGIIWIFALGLFMLAGGLIIILPGAFDNVASNGSILYPQTRAEPVYVVPGYAAILQNCKASASAYVTFELSQVYNLTDVLELPNKLVITPDPRNLNEQMISAAQQMSKIKELSYKLWKAHEAEPKFQNLQTEIQNLEKEVSAILINAKSVQSSRGAVEEVHRHVTHYAEFVYNEINGTVGSCEPLYNVLTSTLHVFSYKVGSPIGAYWFSLNFLLFLLYPIVITAIFTIRL